MFSLLPKEYYPADVCRVVEIAYDISDALAVSDLDIYEADYGYCAVRDGNYSFYITERGRSHTAVYVNKDAGYNTTCLGLYGCTDEDSDDDEVFVARNIYTPSQVLIAASCVDDNARTIDICRLLDAISTLCLTSGCAFSDLNAVLTHLRLGGLYPFDTNTRIQTSIKPKVIWLN